MLGMVRTIHYHFFTDLFQANIHLNVVSEQFSTEVKEILEPWVYDFCRDCGGSVSAEHGIGQLKRKYLSYGKSETHLRLLRAIKDTFDPNGILNPHKMFPDPKE